MQRHGSSQSLVYLSYFFSSASDSDELSLSFLVERRRASVSNAFHIKGNAPGGIRAPEPLGPHGPLVPGGPWTLNDPAPLVPHELSPDDRGEVGPKRPEPLCLFNKSAKGIWAPEVPGAPMKKVVKKSGSTPLRRLERGFGERERGRD